MLPQILVVRKYLVFFVAINIVQANVDNAENTDASPSNGT